MTNDSPKSYDRQPNDTPKSWAAFCCYRDLGSLRSLDKAYRFWQKLPQDSTKTAPRYFCQWSIDFNWVKRISDFDADEQQRRRQEQAQEHDRQIRDLQSDALLFSKNVIVVANNLVAVCGAVSNHLVNSARSGQPLTREQISIAATTASTLKNAIAAGELASKLRGDSLYLNDLFAVLQKFDETDRES